MIRTIADLDKYTKEEIEDVRKTINLVEHYYNGSRILGRKTGLTLSEYQQWQAGEPKDCRTCSGTGKWKPPVRSVGTIHASSAHTCRRRLYYDVVADKAPKQTLAPELLVTFAMGHAIHDHAQKALHVSLGDKFRDEVRVDLPEAFVTNSRTDGLIEFPNCRVVLEIKSIGSEFERLTEPKKEHILQAMGIYATALDAPFVSFLYVSKKWPHKVKEFVLTYNERIFETWWVLKGSEVEKALVSGIAPFADATKEMCRQCPYSYFCEQRQ